MQRRKINLSKVKKCMLVAIALTVGFTFKATNVLAATLHQENTQYYYDRSMVAIIILGIGSTIQ